VAVTVLVPGLLASQAGGKREFEVEGATLRAALRELPLRDLLFDESGALRPLVNVYVDRQDMRMREGLDTVLEGGEEIRIVAAIAGGCA
jgi:molybdopterin synthase sulfur carrier subunit